MAAQTVAVVFTDLVGSTELMSRVGEAAADELRRDHFARLRAAVAAHGGREVKNLGDGLMVVFDGVTAALAGAVAMQQAVTAGPSDAEPLAIRVGVAVGEAELEDGDYFGLPVIEAARLCAEAEAGEILATELVRLLARSRSEIELVSVGALELKGLDAPVDAYRVVWAPIDPATTRAPLPARLDAARSATFVGRDAERSKLADVWKTVLDGACRLMLLAGEPGIGKTTLAARFASDVYDEGELVVYGRSDEDLGVPYQPWIEALGQLVADAREPVLAAHVADRGAHLARLVPELARRLHVEVPASGDGDSERFVLYGCVTDLLARVAAEQPVLIVLDDLHWADRATVQLLRHVATADQAMHVGVLGTFRDSDIGSEHPVSELLAALHRVGGAERITLAGLGDLDVLALLETFAGHEMDEQGVALRDALLAETAGNPFFVAEILRHLAETGAIYQQDDGRWIADADLRAVGLPVSVREVIARRVATLGRDTERFLTYAAVIGRDFDTALVAAVTEVDEDIVIDACDTATQAAILQPTDTIGRYTFAHALIEHTLYERLSPTRRARAHRAVAEHLEELAAGELGARVGELAYHWAKVVQPADTTKAIHYAQLAGDRALEQLAPDEAIRWYQQALELLAPAPVTDVRKRLELLVGLGVAQRQSGDSAYRETLLDAARTADQNDEIDLLTRAVLANNRGWTSAAGVADADRNEMIDRAVQRIGTQATAERARLLALAALEKTHASPLAERVALAQRAVADARTSGDTAALAKALHVSVFGITHPSTLALRTEWLDEACQLEERLGDAEGLYWAHNLSLWAAIERADGNAFDQHWSDRDAIARRIADTTIQWTSMFHGAWLAGLRGDLIDFERIAETALNYGIENGEADAFVVYGAQLVNLRWHQGRLHEIVPLLEQSVGENPGIPAYRAALAAAKAYAGCHDEVRTMLAEAAADSFLMSDDYSWSIGMVLWAEATALSVASDVAAALRDVLAPYHDQIALNGAAVVAAIAYYLGLLDHVLGDYDAAAQWFSEALGLHQRVRSAVLIARTCASWASLLADRNQGDDHDRARMMARAALDAATAGGYGYIETDARAVLDRLS